MRNQHALENYATGLDGRLANLGLNLPRRAIVGAILLIALFAFELFNFDTTRYALRNLMGDVRFLSFQWAAILAIAFCSIDFAGLVRLFTPERGKDEPKEVWYLMGAWLLGATMNALMTWWAVSLTLLNHDFGNEVLSRQQLLEIVPVFVAVLVWLTRILFIGAFTVAGEHIFDFSDDGTGKSDGAPRTASEAVRPAKPRHEITPRRRPVPKTSSAVPAFLDSRQSSVQPTTSQQGRSPAAPVSSRSEPARSRQQNSRIRKRPPMPNGIRRVPLNGVQARPRNRN